MGFPKQVLIGQRLKEAREKACKSQEEVALSIGISTSTLSKIECGRVDPKLSTFLKILDYLHISSNMIFQNDCPETRAIYKVEIDELLKGCSSQEMTGFLDVMHSIKKLMRRGKDGFPSDKDGGLKNSKAIGVIK